MADEALLLLIRLAREAKVHALCLVQLDPELLGHGADIDVDVLDDLVFLACVMAAVGHPRLLDLDGVLVEDGPLVLVVRVVELLMDVLELLVRSVSVFVLSWRVVHRVPLLVHRLPLFGLGLGGNGFLVAVRDGRADVWEHGCLYLLVEFFDGLLPVLVAALMLVCARD